MRFFRSLKSISLLAIFVTATALHAQGGLSDAIFRLNSAYCPWGGLFGPSLVTADFNHDGHPDGALLVRVRTNFRIEVHLHAHLVRSVTFTSDPFDLAISVVDVNHDGSPDLVVENILSRQRIFVWLNDGGGGFYAASVADYPATPLDCNPGVTTTLPSEEGSWLIKSGKIDHRQPSQLDRQTIVPRAPYVGEFVRIIPSGYPSHNIVRGSPVLLSL